MRLNRAAFSLIALLSMVGPLTALLNAQDVGNAIRAVARPDGLVFVYHTADLPLGYGFRLYRNGSEITNGPVYSVQTGSEFQDLLGRDYAPLEASLQEDNPAGVLMRTRAERVLGLATTFLYPGAARALGRLYVDSTATIGSTVEYAFEIIAPNGDRTGDSISGQATLSVWQIEAPANVSASAIAEAVEIKWRYPVPSAGRDLDDPVIKFNVYRNADSGTQLIAQTPVLRNAAVDTFSSIIQPLAYGKVERYHIRAVDVTGWEGPRSEVVEFLVPDIEPPQVVPAVKADARGRNTVEVQWARSPSTDVASYVLMRADRGDDSAVYDTIATRPAGLENLRYVDGAADGTGGQGYFYSVIAVDSAGNQSVPSAPVMALVYDLDPPLPVTDLSAEYVPEYKVVELTWRPVEQPRDFQTYIVLRRRLAVNAADADAQLNQQDLRDTSWVDFGPDSLGFSEDEVYRWTIMSADSTRNFSDSTIIEYAIPNVHPPAAPTELNASNIGGLTVQLNWVGSPDLDLERYRIYRSGIDTTDSLVAETFDHLPTWEDETVTAPRTYVYRVSALDTGGNESILSDSVSIQFLDSDPPRSVRNVRARPNSSGGNTVTWEPVIAHDLAGYAVERSDAATGRFNEFSRVDSDTTSLNDPEGDSGSWYRVIALDSSGNRSVVSKPAPVAEPASPDSGE